MQQYSGKSIFRGIAIGKICYFEKQETVVRRVKISDPEAELRRYADARAVAAGQLKELYEKALEEVGEENARIFEVHGMMLEDGDFNDSVTRMIRSENVNAEYAVAAAEDHFARMFEEMEDAYFRARAADIRDIAQRLTSVLEGGSAGGEIREKSILVAEDLSPSETVQMDKEKVLAFVTRQGSANSHTAILARTMNIPALIGVDIRESWNGKLAVVDGYEGKLILEPDADTLAMYEEKQRGEQRQRELLQEMRNRETVTKSGQRIRLYANIGSVSDVAEVLQNGADGIGLFRSEFLYLGRDTWPTENEQFLAYRQVAERMAGKKVIIRTLDIGADKQAAYFHLGQEENPAMGYRAIRICLTQPEIFKTQLRAIFRASAFGNLAVMYPMIISVDEVRQIRQIAAEVQAELDAAGISYARVEQGVMIETPAAVLISEELAREVDFFSIGTNDLTQYTLAVDRQNAKLDAFYDPHHPAVLRMIRMTVENAHKAGIWAGICGELGADTSLTRTFLQMGVDELSVSPALVLPVRKAVRDCD